MGTGGNLKFLFMVPFRRRERGVTGSGLSEEDELERADSGFVLVLLLLLWRGTSGVGVLLRSVGGDCDLSDMESENCCETGRGVMPR